jgi:hypothetical protein
VLTGTSKNETGCCHTTLEDRFNGPYFDRLYCSCINHNAPQNNTLYNLLFMFSLHHRLLFSPVNFDRRPARKSTTKHPNNYPATIQLSINLTHRLILLPASCRTTAHPDPSCSTKLGWRKKFCPRVINFT